MMRRLTLHVGIFLFSLIVSSPAVAAKVKVDFNGDGKADAFIENVFNGELSALLVGAGGVVQQKATYGTVAPSGGYSVIAISDFNGDGNSDLLLRNSSTGELGVWYISGGNVISRTSLGGANSEWAPIDVNDYNGDGKADVLWRNSSTGDIYLWLPGLASGSLARVPLDSGWFPIGFADFNGDGSTDILWRHSATGAIYMWLVNGLNMVPVLLGAVDPSSGYVPVMTADFNGDKRADIMWRNTITGAMYLWCMNGPTTIQHGFSGPQVDSSQPWVLSAAADFDGDGIADELWRNPQTGELRVALIHGVGETPMVSIGGADPGTGWFPIGSDDYNGDGSADILWRNVFTDNLYLWLMNDSAVLQARGFYQLPSSVLWQVQFPR